MHGPLVGEFMGTLVLILLGDGVVANVLLNKSKGQNSGCLPPSSTSSNSISGSRIGSEFCSP